MWSLSEDSTTSSQPHAAQAWRERERERKREGDIKEKENDKKPKGATTICTAFNHDRIDVLLEGGPHDHGTVGREERKASAKRGKGRERGGRGRGREEEEEK